MKKLFNISLGIIFLFFSLLSLNTAFALSVVFSEDRPDLRTLDPRITQSRHEEMIIVQMFDQLISADSNGNLYPGLAKSWDVSSDGLHYTFNLRDDVTFHDGTKFDAAAVKATFDSIVSTPLQYNILPNCAFSNLPLPDPEASVCNAVPLKSPVFGIAVSFLNTLDCVSPLLKACTSTWLSAGCDFEK